MDRFTMAYTVLGGLGIFFLGIKFLSESLQAIAGDTIRKIINWLTTNRIMAVLVGTLVTTIVQSSSITTVMVVGMANAGLMSLTQAIGVIFGANIGTTITGWIIAIKVGKYGLLFIALGAFPMFFTKNDNWRALGKLLVALGFVFIGLETMSTAFKPLRTDKDFISWLHYFTADTYISVLGCIAMGCLLTMIVQSSSAMLGITIALASTGAITFQTAMALVFGENIGTTITALLASVGTNPNAKRAARAHALFNVLGVTVISFIFWHYVGFIDWMIPGDANKILADGSKPLIAAHIATGHSIFNVTATLIFLPFLPYLAKLVTWLTPDEGLAGHAKLRPLSATSMAPAIGLEQAEKEVEFMMQELKSLLEKTRAYISLDQDDPKLLDEIVALEDKFDIQQKDVTVYMCEVMESPLTHEQSSLGYALIRMADEIESISDYCSSLARLHKKVLANEEIQLSEDAKKELQELFDDVYDFYLKSMDFSKTHSQAFYDEYKIKSHQIGAHADRTREAHLTRIKSGKCSALAGLVFSDMILSTRRIKNHTVNIDDAIASGYAHDFQKPEAS